MKLIEPLFSRPPGGPGQGRPVSHTAAASLPTAAFLSYSECRFFARALSILSCCKQRHGLQSSQPAQRRLCQRRGRVRSRPRHSQRFSPHSSSANGSTGRKYRPCKPNRMGIIHRRPGQAGQHQQAAHPPTAPAQAPDGCRAPAWPGAPTGRQAASSVVNSSPMVMAQLSSAPYTMGSPGQAPSSP